MLENSFIVENFRRITSGDIGGGRIKSGGLRVEDIEVKHGRSLKNLLVKSTRHKVNRESFDFTGCLSWYFNCCIKKIGVHNEKEFACLMLNIMISLAGFVWGVLFLFLYFVFEIGEWYFCIPPFVAVLCLVLNILCWICLRKYQLLLNIFAVVIIVLPIVEQIIMGGMVLSGGMFLWCTFGILVTLGLESCTCCLIFSYLITFLGFTSCVIYDFIMKHEVNEEEAIYLLLIMFYLTVFCVGVMVSITLCVLLFRLRKYQNDYGILLSSFPKRIIPQLRRGKHSIFHESKHVTIMFLDMCHFTDISLDVHENAGAIALVKLMNYVFSELDRIKRRYPDLSKIKQLGDGVMYAGGLFIKEKEFNKRRKKKEKENLKMMREMGRKRSFLEISREKTTTCCLSSMTCLFRRRKKEEVDHRLPCEQMCDYAIEVIDFFRSIEGMPLKIRIGIHTGDLVCGVIGNPIFFDIFGHSVNAASRMESSSQPMKIQVSKDVVKELCRESCFFTKKYRLEDRGKVEIKGIGLVRTLWLSKGETKQLPHSLVGTVELLEDFEKICQKRLFGGRLSRRLEKKNEESSSTSEEDISDDEEEGKLKVEEDNNNSTSSDDGDEEEEEKGKVGRKKRRRPNTEDIIILREDNQVGVFEDEAEAIEIFDSIIQKKISDPNSELEKERDVERILSSSSSTDSEGDD